LFARTAAVLDTVWHYRDALGWSEWPRGAVPAQEDHPRPTATRARARPRRPRRRPARGEGGHMNTSKCDMQDEAEIYLANLAEAEKKPFFRLPLTEAPA
jgi:hypothetical protein